MILGQRLGIGHQRAGFDPLSGFTIEGDLGRLADNPTEGRDRPDRGRLPGPSSLGRAYLAVRQGKVRAALKCDQKVERLDLIAVSAAGVGAV